MKLFYRAVIIVIGLFYSIASATPLTIKLPSNLPPFVYAENGQQLGTNIQIINEISERLGKPIHVEMVPWNRLVFELETNKLDAAMLGEQMVDHINSKLEGKGSVVKSKILFSSTAYVYLPADSKLIGKPAKDYENIKLGAIKGWLYEMPFETENLIEVNTDIQLIELLNNKRVDAIAIEELPMAYHLKTMGIQKEKFKATYDVITYPIVFAFPSQKIKGEAELLKHEIDKIIMSLKKENFINSILTREKKSHH